MSAHKGADKLVFTTLSVFSCLIFCSFPFLLSVYLSISLPTQRQSFTLSLVLALQRFFSSWYSLFHLSFYLPLSLFLSLRLIISSLRAELLAELSSIDGDSCQIWTKTPPQLQPETWANSSILIKAAVVSLWVRWIGKAPEAERQRGEWGCCPINTLRHPLICCLFPHACTVYSTEHKPSCLQQLVLAAVCIDQYINTSFDQEKGTKERAWQWFSMHVVTSSQGWQVVAVGHGSPTFSSSHSRLLPPLFSLPLPHPHPSVLLLPDSFYRSADFTNRPHWLNLILVDRAALLSGFFSVMDRSVCGCVFVCYVHAWVHVRDDKGKLPFLIPCAV